MSIIIFIVAIFTLLFLIIAANLFYDVTIKPGGAAKLAKGRYDPSIIPPDPVRIEAAEWWRCMPIEELHITSHDGLLLTGYYIENESPSGRLVILAHGYNGEASEMSVYAKIYYKMGFSIFAPDNRSHGKSEGNAIGMGWLDKKDYLKWMEFLNIRKSGKSQIILHGVSMGGAVVSMLSGEKLSPNVKGIVSDCAFDSVKNEFEWQLKNLFKLPPFPLIPMTSFVCKLRAGYFFGQVNVAKQVSNNKLPILFIHGEDDTFVTVDMAYKLYAASDPSLRAIWVVAGAKHTKSVTVDYNGYSSLIKSFIEKTCCDA